MKIKFDNEESLERAIKNSSKPNFTVIGAKIVECGEWGFEIAWDTASAGFGRLTFVRQKDGSFKMSTETMSRRFVKDVLSLLAEETEEL